MPPQVSLPRWRRRLPYRKGISGSSVHKNGVQQHIQKRDRASPRNERPGHDGACLIDFPGDVHGRVEPGVAQRDPDEAPGEGEQPEEELKLEHDNAVLHYEEREEDYGLGVGGSDINSRPTWTRTRNNPVMSRGL